jgi:uncharacterized protein
MKHFFWSNIFTVIGLVIAWFWGGASALVICALLIVLEVSFSFDNAVVNAAVLKNMSEVWQKRFLTWGILIAVFGMRFLFPIVIVAFATGLGMNEVVKLAFDNPDEYSRHVLDSHIEIAAFGGAFLMMVFLKFVCDKTKDEHWIGFIESRLSRMGKLESVEAVLVLCMLMVLSHFIPEASRFGMLMAGTVGVVLYVLVNGMTGLAGGGEEAGHAGAKTVAHSGLMGFLYLNLLDASFSLDGVIGAFAISKDVVIIMLGLGIGAFFVRSLTIFLVRKGTLDNYIFLEHGAHWGIGALAVIMLLSMVIHVSEIITGFIGLTFILLSLWSSVKHKRLTRP